VRIGVLASGTGSILGALLEAELPIEVVIVDRPCQAQKVAELFGVTSVLVQRDDFSKSFDRAAYTERVVEVLHDYGVELVVMAGFGTVLSAAVHRDYPERVMNTHPALLPAFKGWHAVTEALAAGVKVTGCTVHLATVEVDEGLILAQEAVPVLSGDTEESLHERIKEVERRLYPETVWAVLNRLDNGEELS
jgi:phosphoribosylglycinamide formyltransferase 1